MSTLGDNSCQRAVTEFAAESLVYDTSVNGFWKWFCLGTGFVSRVNASGLSPKNKQGQIQASWILIQLTRLEFVRTCVGVCQEWRRHNKD